VFQNVDEELSLRDIGTLANALEDAVDLFTAQRSTLLRDKKCLAPIIRTDSQPSPYCLDFIKQRLAFVREQRLDCMQRSRRGSTIARTMPVPRY